MKLNSEENMIYEIIVQGHIKKYWDDWFNEFEITILPNGQTLLSGNIKDQPELHSLLSKIRDLGIKLIKVEQVN